MFCNFRKISSREELSQVQAETLYNWFTCDFTMLDMGSLTSDFHMYYSIRTRPYYSCLKQHRVSRDAVATCLYLLDGICVQRELRAIKTVRLDMSTVLLLMKKLPTLKVVHLFRDPRAILHSHVRVKLSVWDDLERQAYLLCSKILSDIQTAKFITHEYKDQYKMLMYENLVESPIKKSRQLYKWANITMHKYIESYVHYLTNTSRHFTCEWCVKRPNSVETSRRWRKSLQERHMKIIDKHCHNIYKELGYQHFSNKTDLRDLTIPSKKLVQFTMNAL